MGSPYTRVHVIPVKRFEEFEERLEVVKAEGTLAAWRSFFRRFGGDPEGPIGDLLADEVIGDGVEPDWFDESLVSALLRGLKTGCHSYYTEPNLIQDMWYGHYQLFNRLHDLCTTPEEHLQACLLRLLLLDKYMLGVALGNCPRERLPDPLFQKLTWIVNDRRGRPKPPAPGDKVDRDAAARVVFQYRYPCCLLCSVADESILSPDQVGQLARASRKGGILERFRNALPEEADVEGNDLAGLSGLLRRLREPYPYLHAIAYGT
jgi:hypothetical protein